ncbi:MAG: YkgJ family cysteine cluster protein, partial [Myxococcota bacterium]
PPMLNPCRLCKARCCYTRVKVTLPDVLRLCHTLDVPFFSAFTFDHSDDAVRGVRLEADPRVVDPEDGWTGLAEIRLRRGEGGACIGLVDVAGYERCGMYGARPMNCRLYPASWEDERGKGGPNAVLCPAPFAITPSVAAQVETDSVTARRDWDLHEAVVAEWNAADTPPTVEAALDFLLPRAADAMGVSLDPAVLTRGTVVQRLTRELSSRGMIPQPPEQEPAPFAGLPTKGRPM